MENKSLTPKNSKNKKRAFAKAAAFIACALIKIAFRNKVVKKTPVDYSKNYLILCTHGSGLDMLHTMAALKDMDYKIVAARKLFYGKATGMILRLFDAIPKKQFIPDLAALKVVKSAADNGYSIFLCPEGRSTPDGANSYISPAISKMVKWMGLPVLFVNPKGSYLSYPRWTQSPRFGKITTEVDTLFTKREVKALSDAEIYKRIVEKFTFNEYDYQIDNGIKFLTPSPAKKIENLLFMCPSCKSSGKTFSTAKHICCKECGLKAEVKTDGTLDFKDGARYFSRIDEWVEFQKNEIAKLAAKPGFSYSVDADLLFEDDVNNSYITAAEGVLTVDKKGVTFEAKKFIADIDREKYSKVFYPAANLSGLSYGPHSLELYAYDVTQKYMFKPNVLTYEINLVIGAVFNMSRK
ncbi:MAG: 1-acyl-sn-glycerol-3-phosphate acyltransferase [Clostridiales bacterium]|jgi:1-acyl-sn-glycerol-3-phosphate acyltransferase|nr:1-acyl-sn-glycerol-3-phosphate acyltransferase [Clostridiales bacterium]